MKGYYAGADWVQSALKIQLSPLGIAVADLLGDLFLGIYHLPQPSLERVDWGNERYMSINLKHTSLATVDFDQLTRLVFLCHDRCIRGEIEACAPGLLRISFSNRQREGRYWQHHPTLEDALTRWRQSWEP